MNIVEIPIGKLMEAPWNPNVMDATMLFHLTQSILRFGLVEPLIVRPIEDNLYEVLSGNQRVKVLRDRKLETVPCVVVHLNDTQARLLAEVLNNIHGEENLGLRAAVVRDILERIPEDDVIGLLPDSIESLKELASLGQETIAERLAAFERAKEVGLKHFQAQLTVPQWAFVERTLEPFLRDVKAGEEENPNRRGLALYRLCQAYSKPAGAQP